MSHNTVVGDIIDIDHGTSLDGTPVYTRIAKTRGEVSVESNVSIAEDEELHDTTQTEKEATGEAWVIEFENKVAASLGGLDELGLIDGDGNLSGFTNLPRDGSESIRIRVYEDEDAKSTEDFKVEFETTDALVVYSGLNLQKTDFSAGNFAVHSRERLAVGQGA